MLEPDLPKIFSTVYVASSAQKVPPNKKNCQRIFLWKVCTLDVDVKWKFEDFSKRELLSHSNITLSNARCFIWQSKVRWKLHWLKSSPYSEQYRCLFHFSLSHFQWWRGSKYFIFLWKKLEKKVALLGQKNVLFVCCKFSSIHFPPSNKSGLFPMSWNWFYQNGIVMNAISS